MNLTWHIVRKDLIRLRLPLALWSAALLLLASVPSLLWWWTPPSGQFSQLVGFASEALIPIFAVLSGFFFVVQLLQEDTPADASAFWLTRPISGPRLLGAKLITLTICWLIATAPSLLVQHLFTPAPLAWHFLFWLKLTAWAVIPALALGAITRSPGASFFAAIASLLSLLLAGFLISLLSKNRAGLHFDLSNRHAALTGIIIAITCLATVAHQYLSRRTARSIVLIGAGFILSFFLIRHWDGIPGPRHPAAPAAAAPALASDIALTPRRIEVTSQPSSSGVSAYLDLTGIPSDHYPVPIKVRHQWEGAGETGSFLLAPARNSNAEQILHRDPTRSYPAGFMDEIPTTLSGRLFNLNPKPDYTGTYTFRLFRTDAVLEVPLQPDTRAENSGHRLYLKNVDTHSGRIEFLTFDPPGSEDGPDAALAAAVIGPLEVYSYAVYDRRTGRPWTTVSSSTASTRSLGVCRRELGLAAASSPEHSPGSAARHSAASLPNDWAENAVLVKLRHTPVGDFTRTLHAPEVLYTVINLGHATP